MDVPETVEAAEEELQRLGAWFQDFQARQQQVAGIQQRAAFLQGWIAAQSPSGPSLVSGLG